MRLRNALLFPLSLSASPAVAQGAADATTLPPPPYQMEPVLVLLAFLAIFVAAAWSLSALMGITRPVRLLRWPRLRV